MSCALAAASMIPPAAPVQAMPRPALDIEIKAPADVQSVTHRGYYRRGYYPRWRGGYYGGWPGYYPGYRRAGIAFYFGSGGYYPRRHYYGNRYYYGTRYYGPGYYPGYYPYRYYGAPYRPGYYGHRYYRYGW